MKGRIWRKAIFVLLPATFLVAVLEAGLRLMGIEPEQEQRPPFEFVGQNLATGFPFEWDDEIFWRMKPHGSVLGWVETLNADGFRGPEVQAERAPAVRGLVCLGDSCTFGVGVRADATFAHRLSRWLATAEDSRWQVLNRGVPAWSAFQASRWFARSGRSLAPNILVVYVGAFNDFGAAFREDDEEKAERLATARARRWYETLRIVQVVQSLRGRESAPDAEWLARRFGPDPSGIQQRPDGPRLTPDSFRRAVHSLSRDGHAAGAAVIFIVPPAPEGFRRRQPDSDLYAEIVREVAATAGDTVVDVRRHFSGPPALDDQLFCDFIHPSETGHGLIALLVAREMAQLGLPGLPRRALSDFPLAPVILAERLEDVRYEAGSPLTTADASVVDCSPEAFRVPVPARLHFAHVPVPVNGSLLVDLAGNPCDRGTICFEIAIEDGKDRRRVLREELKKAPEIEPGGWTLRRTCRIDLAEFGGHSVDLTLEVHGAPGGQTDRGRAQLQPFR